ncbi:MAG: 2Fe-2S iron-sulfur cluster-binding protein, partial [Acetatifactor sp.]|nr:2Fe-2S iron-sulfur cluster-binding protein [Acetatifactor sp.]
MDYITIDGRCVPLEGEKNLLTVIRKAGIDLPTFCYHSELSVYGACRMCMVEDERGR